MSSSYSSHRKASLYRPEAVLIAEEIRSHGIEAILEQRFNLEGKYHCSKHGMFTDESNSDNVPCSICSDPSARAFYSVDIFLPKNRICLEIKGGTHDSETQHKKDLRKEEYLSQRLGLETISARTEWFLDSKRKPRYEWIAMYSCSIAKLLTLH